MIDLVTWVSWSLKVFESYTVQSGTHDFLLMFHSNHHRPISHRFRDKQRYPSKIANFSHPRVFNDLNEEVPLGIGIGARRRESFYDGLPVEKVKIGLVV